MAEKIALAACSFILACGVTMWITYPPRHPPGPQPVGIPTPTGPPDMALAAELCTLLGRPQELEAPAVNAAVTSGGLPYALASAAAQYGAAPNEGTWIMVLTECRRLGFSRG